MLHTQSALQSANSQVNHRYSLHMYLGKIVISGHSATLLEVPYQRLTKLGVAFLQTRIVMIGPSYIVKMCNNKTKENRG